jgi:putative CocE/NonD family hydrolase
LRFETEPLDEPLEVTGRVWVKLYISSDAPDSDFTAKLLDIYPDGREILLLDGIRRLKFCNGYRHAEPLPPGMVGEIEIDLWSISVIFNRGHKIGLHVSSSNYPRFEINPNTGDDYPDGVTPRIANNTVYCRKSALVLPVVAER